MITKLITATFSVALATATLSASTADAPATSEQNPAAATDGHAAAGHEKKAAAKGKKAAHHGTAHHGKKAKAGKVDHNAAAKATEALNKSSAPMMMSAATVATEAAA
jgi:hypothetical protein